MPPKRKPEQNPFCTRQRNRGGIDGNTQPAILVETGTGVQGNTTSSGVNVGEIESQGDAKRTRIRGGAWRGRGVTQTGEEGGEGEPKLRSVLGEAR